MRRRFWVVGALTMIVSAHLRLGGVPVDGPTQADRVEVKTSQGQRAADGPTQPSTPSDATTHRATLNRYCVTCHNDRLKTAGLALDVLPLEDVSKASATWEKVVRKLRTGDMPPAGRPRPTPEVSDTLAQWLEDSLDAAALAAPNPGRPMLHRLNRSEYANVIRDLLALEIDIAALLPPDDSTHGFDNVADVLGVSPLLLEQYLAAARKISKAAIGNPAGVASTETYRVASDLTQDKHRDGLPLGTRGGMIVRKHFPVDGEYVIKVGLRRSVQSGIRGLAEEHQIEILLDSARIGLFTIGGADSYVPVGEVKTIVPVTKAFTADKHLEVRIPLKAGSHLVGAVFLPKTSALVEGTAQPFLKSYVNPNSVEGLPDVGELAISGPYNPAGADDTPSRRRIFRCTPSDTASEQSCVRDILSTLARRAYRRPVAESDLETLVAFYQRGRAKGTFENGIESALTRLLMDPHFVFRVERQSQDERPGVAYRIPDLELASRMSFFLWSSIPDDELLHVATQGQLGEPRTLERQVRRMLADARASALVSNFAGQWLYLRNLTRVRPNPTDFPDFDDNLRHAFRRETELLFTEVLNNDRSILELLDADYTFVNERLARHYGIPNVYGDHFRRVKVVDENRRGLLGHGSLLTVTSHATRTSPVLRGKWILENVIGSPPPPPPPDVPDLPESPRGQIVSMRERMVQHRANPVCASCHSRMDPPGLALENFDAIGRWRSREGSTVIDATGAFADGTKFDGPASLRQALLMQPGAFATTLTEKLLIYALGRGLEHSDAPAVRAIVRRAAAENYRLSSILDGIVMSTPFRMRRADGASLPQAP